MPALDPLRARTLAWQCRRGLLELDWLLDEARALLETLPLADQTRLLADLDRLLTQADLDLQAWLIQGEEVADPALQAPVQRLRQLLRID